MGLVALILTVFPVITSKINERCYYIWWQRLPRLTSNVRSLSLLFSEIPARFSDKFIDRIEITPSLVARFQDFSQQFLTSPEAIDLEHLQLQSNDSSTDKIGARIPFHKKKVFFRLPSPNSPPPPLPDDELSALLPKLLELQGERHLFLSNRQGIQTSITPELGITDDPVITTQNFDATIQVETPELDENLRKQLLTLLNDFNHLFAGKNTELGHTGLIKHTIDVQGHSPFRLPPNRSALKSRLLSRLPTCY